MTKALLVNSVSQQVDIEHMRAALQIAGRGLGNVWPNPAVGCVLVREDLSGNVVGRGWTQPTGRPHAETVAIKNAGKLCRGATAYVTLEPCAHEGETPPCAEQLINAGISKIFVATIDPDKRVSGAGIARLRSSGIPVIVGLLETEARQLNEGFFHRVENDRPYVIMKLATTMDSQITAQNGESQWITGEQARRRGHLLRARCDAIITGVGTVIADNPRMTCRLPGLESCSPIRIILDSYLRTPVTAKIIEDSHRFPTWIITRANQPSSRADELASNGCNIIEAEIDNQGLLDIAGICRIIASKGVTRLLVEGGSKLTTSFFKTGLVDELHWFRAPKLLGSGGGGAIGQLNINNLKDAMLFDRTMVRSIDKDSGDIEEIFRRRK